MLFTDATFYGFLETVACAIQVGFHFRLAKSLHAPSSLRATSEVVFFLLAAADLILCIAHLLIGAMFDRLFSWFAVVALLKFVLFSVQFKLIFLIWHARRPQDALTGPNALHTRNQVYARFYCALLLVAAAVYQLLGRMLPVAVFVLFSFLLPQVFANAYFDAPRAVLPVQRTFFFASAARLFVPVYFWGVGSGIARLFPVGHEAVLAFGRPHPWMLLCLLVWYAGQVALLEWQRRDEGMLRRFVPKVLLPTRHEYRPVFTSGDMEFGSIGVAVAGAGGRGEHEGPRQCAICMSPVDITLDPSGRPEYMVTPCRHWFHAACLTRWFQTGSLNCPVCRHECPPEGGPAYNEF